MNGTDSQAETRIVRPDVWNGLDARIRYLCHKEKRQACFACNKAIRPPSKWWRSWLRDLLPKCPDCGGQLYPPPEDK